MTRAYAAVADDAARRLVAAGFASDEARTDAGVLVRSALGWTTATWLARLRDPAPDDLLTRLEPLVVRRARREPVAYLTGEREFYGRTFRVTPDVLIPRPETELVVEAALGTLRDMFPAAGGGPSTSLGPGRQAAGRVIDIGTGSGCIAISIACERPDVSVVATDVSPAALAIARDNASRLGGRVDFVKGSLLAGQPGPWDVIVSNPPYIARADRAALPADVRDYEPETALFGGDDGLDVIRALVIEAAEALRPGGTLILEIGAGQADRVAALLRAARAFEDIGLRPDLQAIPRVVAARRRGQKAPWRRQKAPGRRQKADGRRQK